MGGHRVACRDPNLPLNGFGLRRGGEHQPGRRLPHLARMRPKLPRRFRRQQRPAGPLEQRHPQRSLQGRYLAPERWLRQPELPRRRGQ